jgi:hypothetical protein
MVHTLQNLEYFYQHLGSLKYMINIIMWIKDTECYTVAIFCCKYAQV